MRRTGTLCGAAHSGGYVRLCVCNRWVPPPCLASCFSSGFKMKLQLLAASRACRIKSCVIDKW